MTDLPHPPSSPAPKPRGSLPFKRSMTLGDSLKSPEGHPVRTLWLGMLILLISFSCKQILVDYSLWNAGSMLDPIKLQLDQEAETNEVLSKLDDKDDEIAKLREEAPEPPEDGKGYDTYRKQLNKHREKVGKLREERQEELKKLKPELDKISESYRVKKREARRDQVSDSSTAIGTLQTTLTLKLLLDLAKLLGAALVIFSALTITFDPNRDGGSKAYATVLGGVAFMMILLSGFLSLLS